MKNFLRPIALSTALTTLMVAAGAAMAQPTAQTPLSDSGTTEWVGQSAALQQLRVLAQ